MTVDQDSLSNPIVSSPTSPSPDPLPPPLPLPLNLTMSGNGQDVEDFVPVSAEEEYSILGSDETPQTKIYPRPQEVELQVSLVKSEKGSLGFTLTKGNDQGCYIHDIVQDPAKGDGRLRRGDRMIMVFPLSNSCLYNSAFADRDYLKPTLKKRSFISLKVRLLAKSYGRVMNNVRSCLHMTNASAWKWEQNGATKLALSV